MERKKTLATLVLACLLVLTFGCITAFAAIHNIRNALWFKQFYSNWCWAAVTETMVNKETPSFTTGGFSSRQARICYIAHGNTLNETGNSVDMIRAMKNLNPAAFSAANWNYISGSSQFNSIMNEILSDDVVGINIYDARPPYQAGVSYRGHSTFAYWVDSSQNNILLGDPWESSKYIDVYRDDLLSTGIYTKAYPGVKMYGGIYIWY